MKTLIEQLSDLQMRLMRCDEVQSNVYATTRTCLLCGARSVVLRTTEDVRAELAKTRHDPACFLGMLYKATLWVAGSEKWDDITREPDGVRFFPAKDISLAAKVMALRLSTHEAFVDPDDGISYPDGRRLFLALDLPMPPEFVAAYEAEKLAGQRRVARVEWEKKVEMVDRMRDYTLKVLKELNLDGELDKQVRARVEAKYPYPPKPEMVDE